MSIAIIDLDSVMYTIGNGNKILDENGVPKRSEDGKRFLYIDKTHEELIQSADQIMNSILTNSGTTYYIAYIKGQSTTLSRLQVYPDYKANRSGVEPTWWQFCKQYMIKEWKALEVHGMEVDDAVNLTRLHYPDSFICAIDGDLLGLEGKHHNWSKNVWVEVSEKDANVKFWSDMISGQKGDNIHGLKGRGIKYVETLFKKINYHSDLEYAELVFSAYLTYYNNVTLALKEFNKNYTCLKILSEHDNFTYPEPIKVTKRQYLEQIQDYNKLFE